MNSNYGKIDGEGDIEFAPSIVAHDGRSYINPTAEDYARADDGPWLPVVETYPIDPPPEGYHWKRTGKYELYDGGSCIAPQYIAEEDPKPTVADYDAAMEKYLYDERAARGYTTREPDMYIGSQVPRWNADAEDWKHHRDAVMLYALDVMNRVEAGEPPPTIEAFVAGLPRIEWSYNAD